MSSGAQREQHRRTAFRTSKRAPPPIMTMRGAGGRSLLGFQREERPNARHSSRPDAQGRVFAILRGYHWLMATVVKRLDLTVGELVEVAGRRYEVVPDREGGVTIEPPITSAAQLHAQRGTKPASAEDFERLSADVPYDDEG